MEQPHSSECVRCEHQLVTLRCARCWSGKYLTRTLKIICLTELMSTCKYKNAHSATFHFWCSVVHFQWVLYVLPVAGAENFWCQCSALPNLVEHTSVTGSALLLFWFNALLVPVWCTSGPAVKYSVNICMSKIMLISRHTWKVQMSC